MEKASSPIMYWRGAAQTIIFWKFMLIPCIHYLSTQTFPGFKSEIPTVLVKLMIVYYSSIVLNQQLFNLTGINWKWGEAYVRIDTQAFTSKKWPF